MIDDQKETCICPRICIGMKVTEARNLSPNCPVHADEYDKAATKLGFHK
jgi:hypothetical protein